MNPDDYRIIDCHIHPAAVENEDTSWFFSSGSMSDQIDTLRRCGISRACGSVIRRFDPEMEGFDRVRALNDRALELRDQFPDFYVPGVHIHPHFPDVSCREIERCCGREGVRWIGELVGYMMGYGQDYVTEEALTIFRAASASGATVNFHCGSLEVIERLCTAVPDLSLVLAHPGDGKAGIMDRLALVAKYPNLHLDISGSGIDRYGVIRTAIDTAGTEKVLFGTDYPINNPAVYVYGALLEPLSEEERVALFGGNFLRLVRQP